MVGFVKFHFELNGKFYIGTRYEFKIHFILIKFTNLPVGKLNNILVPIAKK